MGIPTGVQALALETGAGEILLGTSRKDVRGSVQTPQEGRRGRRDFRCYRMKGVHRWVEEAEAMDTPWGPVLVDLEAVLEGWLIHHGARVPWLGGVPV